jgi:hypothetical protein
MGRHRFGPVAAVALAFVVCVSCAGPTDGQDTGAGPSAAPTPSASATVTPTKPSTTGFPRALVGDWRSLDQGSAEVLYSFYPDGTFERAMVLMQSRSSGTFSYSIGMTGTARVDGSRLILKPREGIKSMHDPDSASSSYQDRPLTDLTAETYTWSATEDEMSLDGTYGLVVYARE